MGMYDDQRPHQRQSGYARIILAILIAVIGYFAYLNRTEENPVTREMQHVSISPSDEIRMGLESAPVMAQKMGGELNDNDPKVKLVRQVGSHLVQNTVAKDSPWKFKFHVLADTSTVNAFALPGGQIFITQGLLDKLETEAQLSGVLAHEMGHVIERHAAQQMAKQELGQWFMIAVGTGASDQDYGGYNPVLIAGIVNEMLQLRYGRKDESQADIWGIKLTSKVGLDPSAMIQVMEILKAESKGGHSLEIFQTHPNPDKRIKLIQEYLRQNPGLKNGNEGKKLRDMM